MWDFWRICLGLIRSIRCATTRLARSAKCRMQEIWRNLPSVSKTRTDRKSPTTSFREYSRGNLYLGLCGGLFLFVIENGLVEGLVAEDGAVKFVFGQAAEIVADFFGGDVVGFV